MKMWMIVIVLMLVLFSGSSSHARQTEQSSNGYQSMQFQQGSRVLLPVGWNYFTVGSCVAGRVAGVSYIWFRPTSGQAGDNLFYTSDPAIQVLLAPVCQNGNWVGVHITDPNGLLWDQLWTFTR